MLLMSGLVRRLQVCFGFGLLFLQLLCRLVVHRLRDGAGFLSRPCLHVRESHGLLHVM